MKKERVIEILNHLSITDYVSSEALAAALGLSSRTIRNEIKDINEELKQINAIIEVRPKYGCRLHIEDSESFQAYFQSLSNREVSNIPTSLEERIEYLLELFLYANKWIKIEELCDKFYISQSSLSKCLREVRQYLSEYNIELISKPGYGLKIKGNELNIRLCIVSIGINKNTACNGLHNIKGVVSKINKIIDKIFAEEVYHMSGVSFQNLITYILVALYRISDGHEAILDSYQQEKIQKEPEYKIAEKIVQELNKIFQIDIPQEETCYIAIHLVSKKIVSLDDPSDNVVITDEVNNIIAQMLEAIERDYQIDLRDDFELRMMLALHLVPFGKRMAYDLVLHNPLLKDIKTQYTMAYNLAVSASEELKKHYNKEIKEDEIGYFALHFTLALERKRKVSDKKNIVIVCGTGRGTAQLLLYSFKEHFGKYLNNIITSDALSLKSIDFSVIDYVITTVPIKTKVPVPILHIKSFLKESDVSKVRRFLKGNRLRIMEEYLYPELFFTDVEANSREGVLHYMVERLKKIRNDIPYDFFDAIMKRESLAVTEFGNMVALPHPNRAMTEETFVCICILKKPIIWEKKKVQLVYMTSIEKDSSRDLMMFYKITSKLLVNEEYIKDILQKKSFQHILRLFGEIEDSLESKGE